MKMYIFYFYSINSFYVSNAFDRMKENIHKGRERMTKLRLLIMFLVSMIFLALTACNSNEIPNAKNWDIEEFTFTNQEEESFSKEDLRGKVWVADFIFTSCETVCLPMTYNMSKLQKMLKDEGIQDVELVSFSVDPEVDKPDVLKAYGDQFNVDYTNWHFLTGYKQQEIEQFARESFKTIVVKPQNTDQVTHGTDFYLVDQNGKIVQDYTGLQEIPFEDIIEHIKILQKS